MLLKLKLIGSVEPLANYLKSYARIRESLLLEIDTQKKAFVAKTFTEDHSAIRFASLSFEDANIVIVSDDGETERAGARIKVGILIQFKKFIQMVERFGSDVNSEGKCDFEINVSYEPALNKDKKLEYVSSQVQFNSDILKMKMNGFRISELTYLSDDVFINNIFNVSDPVSVRLDSSMISNIVKTSGIIAVDSRKDALVFFNEGKVLNVCDTFDDKNGPNFVYRIGEMDFTPEYPIEIAINREKFIKMLDKGDDTYNIIIGKYTVNGSNSVDRVLFDSVTSATKIIIAGLKDN